MKSRRMISVLMGFLIIFVLSGPVIANAGSITADDPDVTRQSDIAKVIITTENEINTMDYVGATITIMDSEKGTYATIVDKQATIKIRGNSTASLKKKPYNIKLSTAQSILGMSPGKKWSLLANYLDTSLMRNRLSYEFAKTIGLPYSCDTRFVDVWLNGRYLGNYLMTVPVQVADNRIAIDTKNNDFLLELDMGRVEEDVTYINTYIYRFIIEEPEKITKEQENWLFSYLINAETAMRSGNYDEVLKYIDTNSFIDFFLIQEYFKNMDVNRSSSRFYIKDEKLYAGPVWDMDLSCGNVSDKNDYPDFKSYNNCEDGDGCSYEGLWADSVVSSTGAYDSWFGLLMKYDKFRTAFYKRYVALQDSIVNLYQNNASGTNQIDQILASYGDSFARNNEIYPVSNNRGSELYRNAEKTYEESIQFLRDWLEDRNAWLLKNLRIKQYKLIFVPNGGAVTEKSKQITKECYYGILPEPKRKNYTFTGWYTAVSGGDKVTQTDVFALTHSQKLYAHWEKKIK